MTFDRHNGIEEERRTTAALIWTPLIFSLFLASVTLGLTWWNIHRAQEHLYQQASPIDLLILCFYLLVLVAVIRLLCFAGMLLSASRKDEAMDLMPAIALERRLFGHFHSPSVQGCRRIGVSVLLEAFLLLTVWLVCVVRLSRLA